MLNRTPLLAFNCLAVGSGFYLTQIIAVSPIYPLMLAAVMLSMFGRRLVLNQLPRRPGVSWVFVVATIHFGLYLAWVSPFNSALGFYLNFVALALAWRLLPHVAPEQLNRIGLRMIDVTILIGIAEAIVRWLFPFQDYNTDFLDFVDESGSRFYLYKFNSIMYQDSNFVGMWLLVFAVFAIERYGWHRLKGRIAMLAALLGLTICRSAIIFFAFYLLLKLLRRHVRSAVLRSAILLGLGAAAFAVLAAAIANDDSFQSKLTIFGLVTANYLSGMTPLNVILGIGLSNSAELLGGIAAHNFIVEVAIDAGLLGVGYTVFSLFYLASFAGRAGYAVVWLFLGAGLSFAPVTMPYLFVVMSLLAAMGSGRSTLALLRARADAAARAQLPLGLSPTSLGHRSATD